MLEPSSFQSMENISPFLRAYVYPCCDYGDDQIASTDTNDVDFVNFIYRAFCSPGWTENVLKRFLPIIIICWTPLSQPVASTKSHQWTGKWHCLIETCQDIRQVGGVVYLQCGQFDSSHKIMQSIWCKSAQKNGYYIVRSIWIAGITFNCINES